MMRRLVQRIVVFLKTRLLQDPEARFRARFRLVETYGEIRGMRKVANNAKTCSRSKPA